MANEYARISTAPARRLAAVGKLARADEAAEGMDLPRADRPWWQVKRRWLVGAVAVLVGMVAIFVAANLEPAIPSLPKESVWLGQVEQGEFVRDVRGPGTLAPMQLRWISAESPGRVQEILALPGIEVAPDTPLLRLDNPELEIQLLDARQQLSDAAASLVRLRFQAESDRLAQVALIASVRTQYLEAKHRDEINRELRVEAPGLVADFDLARGEQLVQELANRMRIEARRLGVLGDSTDRQIAALEEQVERLQAIARFHEQRIASLNVTAGVAGVLAELPLQAGQSVQAGDILGRVVEPRRLKAEIRIPQGQAEGIAPGQPAIVDTRGHRIEGTVSRVDPTVRSGTVTIDIALPESLPAAARPDMSVDGTVIIDHIDSAMTIARPPHAKPHTTVGIYRLQGNVAERVPVRLGLVSASRAEVLEGLEPGDTVVLSDMTSLKDHDRVRIDGA